MSTHPYPVGTWVRGHVHGNSFQGRVTACPTPDGIQINGVNFPVFAVLESDMDQLPDWCFDNAPEPRTPAEAISEGHEE